MSSLLAIASTISVRSLLPHIRIWGFLFYDQFVVSSASMVWLAFLWVMVKCTLVITQGAEVVH